MSDSEDLEAKVAALEERVTALENILHDGGGEHDSTGIREFVISIDPSSHKERALAIAYYLDQQEGKENFTRRDIEEGYRTVRTQKPANMSDVLAAMDEAGWIMLDGKDGQSKLRRLTGEGLDEVEDRIND